MSNNQLQIPTVCPKCGGELLAPVLFCNACNTHIGTKALDSRSFPYPSDGFRALMPQPPL